MKLFGTLSVGLLPLAFGATCDGPPPAEPIWHLVLQDLPGGLLSVSGTSSSDVYAVGTDPGDGLGPLVLRYDGQEWTRLETGASGDLWWISDTAIDNSFFMTGEGGLILRYILPDILPGSSRVSHAGASGERQVTHETPIGEFERFEAPGSETIFGVWGRQPNNVIAVGGDESDFDFGGVVWTFDGQTWTDVTSDIDADGIPVLFKVWGRSETEIYAVGARGVVLLYDGSAWTRLDSPTTRTLFGVYGDDNIVVACGGAQSGVIIEKTGPAFQDVTPPETLQMNGTFVTAAGEAFTVGREGATAVRSEGLWMNGDTRLNLDPILHYHGPWSDPDGGVWAVGGNLDGEPVDQGMVVYFGTETISTMLSE